MTVFRGVVANATPTVASELGHSLPTAISQQKKLSWSCITGFTKSSANTFVPESDQLGQL